MISAVLPEIDRLLSQSQHTTGTSAAIPGGGGTSFGLTPVALLSHGGLTQHTELKIIPS